MTEVVAEYPAAIYIPGRDVVPQAVVSGDPLYIEINKEHYDYKKFNVWFSLLKKNCCIY